MIAIPGNVRVWLATGHADMRRGFRSSALMEQEELKRDPHCGAARRRRSRPSTDEVTSRSTVARL
jgi:transposase